MSNLDDRLSEQGWRYFALHSEQRTTVFNFFVASAGLTLSGLFYILATPSAPKAFGVAAGIGAMLLATIFWKLDQRVAQLIKEAERLMIDVEAGTPDPRLRVFERAERLPVNGSRWPLYGTWSYGRSFRSMFLVVGLLGTGGALSSSYTLVRSSSPQCVQAKPVSAELQRKSPAAGSTPCRASQ
jgi:hypothetical protein